MSYGVEAGKIRVEYTLNGVQVEDEIYCVIQSVKTPVGAGDEQQLVREQPLIVQSGEGQARR